MTEVFINIEELNDDDLAITITDEDGIFIDELGDDLLSVSLQELESKLNEIGYILTYDEEEDIQYYIDKFKSIKLNTRVVSKTFRGFLRKVKNEGYSSNR